MSRLPRGALALLVLAAACGDDGDGAQRDHGRDAAIYAAVIRDVAEGAAPVGEAEDEEPADPVVFVETLEPEDEIPLEVQAGVVLELEDHPVEVSFIDDREAAVRADEPGAPVREGAVLLGVGPVPEGTSRVRVQATRYLRDGEDERLRYVVERVGDGWEVVERTTFR